MTTARALRLLLAALLVLSWPISANAQDAVLVLGKKVFLELAQPQCALCHTLADAQATGSVGPILDELKPTADRVKAAVINGIGPMPPNTALSKEEIDAVAAYVSAVAGKTSR